jgi:hypothetical protein
MHAPARRICGSQPESDGMQQQRMTCDACNAEHMCVVAAAVADFDDFPQQLRVTSQVLRRRNPECSSAQRCIPCHHLLCVSNRPGNSLQPHVRERTPRPARCWQRGSVHVLRHGQLRSGSECTEHLLVLQAGVRTAKKDGGFGRQGLLRKVQAGVIKPERPSERRHMVALSVTAVPCTLPAHFTQRERSQIGTS